MLEARSAGEFLLHPEKGFVSGERWMFYCVAPGIFGFSIWGQPDRDDIQGLLGVLEGELERPPHAALVDVSGIDAIAPGVYELLIAWVEMHFAPLSTVVTRVAMVRSDGYNGALIRGFFSGRASPFEVLYCDDACSGLELLGHSAPEAAARTIAVARAEVERVPVLLRELRRWLESRVGREHPSLLETAQQLGVSSRTLQRVLSGRGTSFADEWQEARVRTAERLLVDTDEPITRIALEIGCASPQHLSTLFRRRKGLTPSAYRRQHRLARS